MGRTESEERRINSTRHSRFYFLLVISVLAGPIGCAPAYHRYSGCQVDCRYCAPPPLPYLHYPNCVCHSCAVEPYLD